MKAVEIRSVAGKEKARFRWEWGKVQRKYLIGVTVARQSLGSLKKEAPAEYDSCST